VTRRAFGGRCGWAVLGLAGIGLAVGLAVIASPTLHAAAADSAFKLQSSLIAPDSTLGNNQVYNRFGCRGKNISPPLAWSGAPSAAKSIAVTLYDPDAPTGSGWWHWVVYNIPVSATGLPQGAGNPGGNLPPGVVQGRTDFGTPGYGGPCPPAGDKPHRYVFTVYALNVDRLDVPAGASAAAVGSAISANKLASASLTARYGR
jgi:Raf kinase inhibitor-like YbhB/YbcL family protein